MYAHGVLGIGREVEPAARQILNVGSDSLAVDTVEEDGEEGAGLQTAARLHAPAEEAGVLLGGGVVHIHVSEHSRCAEMALAILAPSDLKVDGNVGHSHRTFRSPSASRLPRRK